MMFPAGDSTQLDLDGLLYIGGVGAPFAPLTVPPALWTGALRQGYVGCMRDLVINGHPVDIAGYAQQQDSGKGIKFLSDYFERQKRLRSCLLEGRDDAVISEILFYFARTKRMRD